MGEDYQDGVGPIEEKQPGLVGVRLSGKQPARMMRRAVLFDLDGTLTDPKVGITRSIQHALVSLDQPAPDANDLTWCIGPPLHESFRTLLNSTDEGLIARAISIYRERFSEVGLYENELIDGIPQLLDRLQRAELELFVATSKPSIFARKIVTHFRIDRFFGEVYGAELDGSLSDKANLIAHLCGRQALTCDDRVAMIGDRHHDITGAIANDIHAIGVTFGYGTREELVSAGAHVIANTVPELEIWLNDYFGSSARS
ncbi:MAG: HAD hydrolase-like protein [Pseudomonadota bacterium]